VYLVSSKGRPKVIDEEKYGEAHILHR
jgi:hypothetical protein